MADWSLPTLASLYTDFHDTLKARDTDALLWLDGTTTTNIPTGAKRWNSTNNNWEKYNGSTWTPLATKYMIDVDTVDGKTVNDGGTSVNDLWTASKISAIAATKLDSSSYTAADVLAKLLTVDGSGSGLDADLLDGQTGSYYTNGDNFVWGSTNTAGKFYTGTTTPTGSTRLNYSGYLYPTSLNLTGQGDTATASSHVFVETGSDGFVRPKTLANFKSEIFASPTFTGTATGTFSGSLTGNASGLTGLTSTVAELNTLDGCTATVTHFNYINTLSSNAQTQLNAKAPLASPVFTGAPAAPTAAVGTNTMQLATTAYVLANSVQLTEFISSKAATGYLKLPDGLIIQWGTGTSSTGYTPQTVTFPLAFTTCYKVIVSGQSSTATTPAGGCKSFTNANAVVVAGDMSNSNVATTPVYIAIGV